MSFGLMLGFGAALARAQDQADETRSAVRPDRRAAARRSGRISDELYRAALDGAAAYLDDRFGTVGNRILSRAEYESADAWDRGHRVGIGVEFEIVAGKGSS
jgi:hypothetical protein